MRIISGSMRGKHIRAPRDLPVRPTTDMAKEGLFNILNNRIFFEDVTVLDLFSGIGSITLEMLSRGCQQIKAVDSHRGCVLFLQKILEDIGAEGVEVVKADAMAFLRGAYETYDIVFADPPYEFPDYDEIIRLVFDRALLTPDGMLVVEHDRRRDFSQHPMFTEQRNYGGVSFSFFVNTAPID
jgi:16S rRNA (guanine(966)-N(2))-methyltransferase RsmD